MTSVDPVGSHRRGVVVGVDGSAGSLAALRWAAGEAGIRGVPLTAVMAFRWSTPSFPVTPYTEHEALLMSDADRAATHLDAALAEGLGPDPGIEVVPELSEGDAGAALVSASRSAELLVVGSRGHGRFSDAVLGSVGEYCLHRAHCPVVVIPAGVATAYAPARVAAQPR